jgi:hypothetical protein
VESLLSGQIEMPKDSPRMFISTCAGGKGQKTIGATDDLRKVKDIIEITSL